MGLAWLFAACVNRWLMAAVVLWALEDDQPAKAVLIYPLRDLLGFAVWVASYLGDRMQYHGGNYSIGKDGRFQRIDRNPPAGPGLPNAPVQEK